MGRLDVHITHGGGPDLSGLVPVAVIAGACVLAASAVAAAVQALLIVAAVILGLAVIAAAAWFGTRRKRAERREAVTARLAANRQAIEEEQHRRRLELRAASAPVITNVIDPAPLLAVLDARQHPWPQPARVIRAEVEK